MTQADSHLNTQPTLEITKQEGKDTCACLSGDWTLSNLMRQTALQKNIKRTAANKDLRWDLRSVNVLDNATALWIWQAWGQSVPTGLKIKSEHLHLFNKWQSQTVPVLDSPSFSSDQAITYLSQRILDVFGQLLNFVTLLGQLLLDMAHLLRHPGDIPWREISITIYESGVRALGITALVGFLIGIVLSYLSALQLRLFGAEIYIIDILA